MNRMRIWFALSLLLLLPAFAHAQLSLVLNAPNKGTTPGGSLNFTGTITNLGATTIFLSGDSFSLSGAGLTLDDSPFFLNAPLSLEAGEIFSALYFTVDVDLAAPLQTALGTFSIIGGASEGDTDTLATSPFSISVSAPEPGSGSLVLGIVAAAAIVGGYRRRRRRAA